MNQDHEVGVGDTVLYVPECEGDRCAHEPIFDRAAIVTKVVGGGVVWLAVLHPRAVAHVPDVPRGQPGQLRSWYPR